MLSWRDSCPNYLKSVFPLIRLGRGVGEHSGVLSTQNSQPRIIHCRAARGTALTATRLLAMGRDICTQASCFPPYFCLFCLFVCCFVLFFPGGLCSGKAVVSQCKAGCPKRGPEADTFSARGVFPGHTAAWALTARDGFQVCHGNVRDRIQTLRLHTTYKGRRKRRNPAAFLFGILGGWPYFS